jgi:hypothetical protein
MPTSPKVDFTVINNNVASITPNNGIGFVLARTTKGPFFDASKIIKSPAQFAEVFGSEVVPDGSISNISRALSMGGQLRICRIGHLNSDKVDAIKGTVLAGKVSGNAYVSDTGETLNLELTGFDANAITIQLKLETKEYGGDIQSTNGKFMVVFTQVGNRVISSLYNTNAKDNLTSAFLVNTNPVLSYKNGDGTHPIFIDTALFKNFLTADPYFDVTITKVLVGSDTSQDYSTVQDVINLLNDAQKVNNTTLAIKSTNTDPIILGADNPLYYLGTVGNAGITPVATDWVHGFEVMKDYSDFYMFFASHIHQHLSEAQAVHQAGYSAADLTKNATYAIEIPKVNTTKATILKAKQGIGINSEHVAYFAGGLRLYNQDGMLMDSDVLGTVFGLSAQAATEWGPWYSFAGQNRGIVGDGNGPVAENFGSPGRYDDLNELAAESINIFVIKEVASGGKATLLWHNFTSTMLSNSERFLNVERLIYYIKKVLRPIMERYLEEPNNFETWSKMYLEVDPYFQDLQNRNGVHSYEWQGDQFATSFDDLQVNNEKDVRQGKYKANLVIKEVVALQEINIGIVLDASSGAINIEQA